MIYSSSGVHQISGSHGEPNAKFLDRIEGIPSVTTMTRITANVKAEE